MLDSSWGVTKEQYRYSKILYLKSVFTVTKFLRITAYILCEKMEGGSMLLFQILFITYLYSTLCYRYITNRNSGSFHES